MVDLSDKVPYVGRLNSVCIPSPSECQDVTFTGSMESDLYTETLNDLFTYSVKNTPECREENQLECSEDESIKMGDIPSCVPTVVACSGDDLLEGVLSGTKSFLPLMSDYGNCQISACAEGYRLDSNTCLTITPPTAITGCMAPGAVNFNPEATIEGECSCSIGFFYDDAQNVCVPNQTVCDEFSYFDIGLNACILN